eukprot:gene14118-15594_t
MSTSTKDFELHDLGSTNIAYDVDGSFGDNETYCESSLNLHKRARKGKSVLRKGPAPLEDLNLIGQHTASTQPAKLGTDVLSNGDDDGASNPDLSRAGSRGLLTYFANLANSPDEEQINVDFVNSLLNGGADINVTDRYGQTIMHEVVRQWHMDIAEFVMECGAEIDRPDSFGRTPLHLAAAINCPEMIVWLIENGADIHRRTKREAQTAIHYAAKYNAVEALKTLLQYNAKLCDRDYKDRTPLFIAAEAGRSDACRLLLEYGAPAGVFDDCGTSALCYMIQKMPDVAKEALLQFQETETAQRRRHFYLNYLEVSYWKALGHKAGRALRQSHARSALQVIVNFNESNLIMHPVILRLVKLKWDLFGKRNATLLLTINIIFTLIWTAIGLLLPRTYSTSYYTPLKDNAVKIVLELIGGLMMLFFILKQVLDYRRMRSRGEAYEQWKIREIERDMQFCHPMWPEEQRYLESEIQLVKSSTFSFLSDPWNIFEWIVYFVILFTAGTRVATVLLSNDLADKIHHRSMAVAIILIWLRLIKYCRAFETLGPFISMLGHVMAATYKFAFLFLVIFIPYCCAVWILFGGKTGINLHPHDVIYHVFMMTVVADYRLSDLTRQEKITAQLLVGSYVVIASIICLNLYIALMSDTFARAWSAATANATMCQAMQILVEEEGISGEASSKFVKVLLNECSPQTIHISEKDGFSFSQREIIDTLTMKVDQLNILADTHAQSLSAILQELTFLKNQFSAIENHQYKTNDEILKLAKDSHKWEARNILKNIPATLSETVKRTFKKEEDDESVFYIKDDPDETKSKGMFGFNWGKK